MTDIEKRAHDLTMLYLIKTWQYDIDRYDQGQAQDHLINSYILTCDYFMSHLEKEIQDYEMEKQNMPLR